MGVASATGGLTGDDKATKAVADGNGGLIKVPVPVAAKPYEVVVGEGVRNLVAQFLPPRARKVAIVTQEVIGWGVDLEVDHETFLIPGGEGAKTMSEAERLCSAFARWGLTRADVVVGIGGGVVTDLAGFAASIYHRGLALVQVPTTLLGQVDAAIGGKCGVNLAEGKNLVGSFWQPMVVLADTQTLQTLPEREWASGRGEMAKYAFLGVEGLERMDLEHQIAECARHKAHVVAADEREGGQRALLNYGHTLAHALEADALARGNDLRHGEAVAIGLHFAAMLAHLLGRVPSDRIRDHLEVISAFGLPSALPHGCDPEALIKTMGRDKKALSGLTFILDGPVGPEVVRGVDPAVVARALSEMPG